MIITDTKIKGDPTESLQASPAQHRFAPPGAACPTLGDAASARYQKLMKDTERNVYDYDSTC